MTNSRLFKRLGEGMSFAERTIYGRSKIVLGHHIIFSTDYGT